jgi:ATP-dependent Clp protease adaptor protein ClpS
MDLKGGTVVHTPDASPSEGLGDIKHGVELLNDNETPMDFVVATLELYLRMDRQTAVKTMLAIHTQGRSVVAVDSTADAIRLSRAITNRARHHKYPLVCRPFQRPTRTAAAN